MMGFFSNKAGENFNLAKIFLNARVWLQLQIKFLREKLLNLPEVLKQIKYPLAISKFLLIFQKQAYVLSNWMVPMKNYQMTLFSDTQFSSIKIDDSQHFVNVVSSTGSQFFCKILHGFWLEVISEIIRIHLS